MQEHHCGAGVQFLEFLCQHFEQLLHPRVCDDLICGHAHHQFALVELATDATESVDAGEEGGLVAVEGEGRGDTAEDAQGEGGVCLGGGGGVQVGREEGEGWVVVRGC